MKPTPPAPRAFGLNPCITCGACCAFFRASFYWGETTDGKPDGVPSEMTVQVTPHRVAMKGTTTPSPRCIALHGEIGVNTLCTIHPIRSTVCRAFPPSWEDNVHNPDCDRARAAHGLPPLEPGWWHPETTDPNQPDTPLSPQPKRPGGAA